MPGKEDPAPPPAARPGKVLQYIGIAFDAAAGQIKVVAVGGPGEYYAAVESTAEVAGNLPQKVFTVQTRRFLRDVVDWLADPTAQARASLVARTRERIAVYRGTARPPEE